MGDGARSRAWGQQPLPQPRVLWASWGREGGDTGTLGSPEDSGSAPGRLCHHGHAPTPAPLPLCLCGSQGGSATRPQREGAQPPRDQHGGFCQPQAQPCPSRGSPRPVPCATCQAMPCAGSSQARPVGTNTSALASRGAVGRGARGFHNPGLAVYLSAGAGPGGGCLFAESAGSQPRGGGKGSRGTRLGRPARRWGGAGMGMALPAPPESSWLHPLEAGPPFSQLTPAPSGKHPMVLSPLGWAPISGWVGVTSLQHRVPQRVWDSHRHCQGTVPDASSALVWGQPLCGIHPWHCRDPGLQRGGLPMAPPSRPWPPSCAGRGEPGEGGAGRTVYVCRCQVLAGHRASRAGAQLLNPLRPPHTTPARDQARPTPPGWLLCTPVTPYSMLHTASSGQKGLGMVAGLAPVGLGRQEELLPRGAPLGPCAVTAPSTQLLPN